jgi:hypothetical protein
VAPLAQPVLKRSVSTNGGRYPVWSRDSRELYYTRGGQIIAVPVSAGNSLQLGTPTPLFEAKLAGGNLGEATPYDVAPDGRFMVNRFVERTAPPPPSSSTGCQTSSRWREVEDGTGRIIASHSARTNASTHSGGFH